MFGNGVHHFRNAADGFGNAIDGLGRPGMGLLKELLYHYHSLTLTLIFLIHVLSTLT